MAKLYSSTRGARYWPGKAASEAPAAARKRPLDPPERAYVSVRERQLLVRASHLEVAKEPKQ